MLVEKLQESSWGLWRVGNALDVLTHVADLKRGVALMEATGKPLSSTPGTLTPKLKLLEQWDLYYLAATACCRMRLSLRLLAGQVKPDLLRAVQLLRFCINVIHTLREHVMSHGLCKRKIQID